jgi:hypothetical protein
LIQVTLGAAMPSSTFGIVDLSMVTATEAKVFVQLQSITSTTVFTLQRWAGPEFTVLALAHGGVAFAVYDS